MKTIEWFLSQVTHLGTIRWFLIKERTKGFPVLQLLGVNNVTDIWLSDWPLVAAVTSFL